MLARAHQLLRPLQTEPKKEDKGKKGGDTGKKGRGKDSRAGRKDVLEEAPQSEPTESAVHPLLEPLEEGAGHQLFMPGNMALVHLTLSCMCVPHTVHIYCILTHVPPDNAIGEDGLRALLEAVRLQGQYSHLGPGLLRLALHVIPHVTHTHAHTHSLTSSPTARFSPTHQLHTTLHFRATHSQRPLPLPRVH